MRSRTIIAHLVFLGRCGVGIDPASLAPFVLKSPIMDVTASTTEVEIKSFLEVSIPVELGVLLDRSLPARSRFWCLEDVERTGLVRFVDEATTASSREWRASIVANSLLGAAVGRRADQRSWQF